MRPGIYNRNGPSRLLLLCALLFPHTGVSALTEEVSVAQDWVVRSWQTKDGLPQNTVYAILQTRDGYLWVGTGGGLARFDGERFRTFGLQDGLRSVQISSLAEPVPGELWVGTRGGGVTRWIKGRFSPVPFGNAPGVNMVEALAAGVDGAVWIGTTRGLMRWQAGVVSNLGGTNGLSGERIRALLEASTGLLWVGTTEGLYRGKDGRFELVQQIPSAANPVYSLCEDREGAIWVGGGNGHLWRFSQGACKSFSQADGVPFQFIECMAQGREGPLWIGTRDGGLHYFNNGRIEKVNFGTGLSAISVRGLTVDGDGALWAGTGASGLIRLSSKLVRIWGAADGLEHRAVNAIAEDSSGDLWAATQRGGVYRTQHGAFTRVKDPPSWAGRPNAYTILATTNGSVWAAGESFLYCFEPNQATRCYVEPPVGGEAIRSMCETDGTIWLGTYYSTLLRADGTGVRVVLTNVAQGAEIRSLAAEGPESLWIGTAAGLYQWKGGELRPWTAQNGPTTAGIQALHREPDGTLWVGTLGGGLLRIKGKGSVAVTTKQGLVDDVVSQIVPDNYGHLWLGCNHGIMRLEKQEIDDLQSGKASFVHTLVLGASEGIIEEQCSGGHSPTALKTKAGRLLFPTLDGIVEIDPRHWLTAPTVIPQTSIEEVRVDGKPQAAVSDLALPPGSRHFEITYGAPSLRAADTVHFRFRMEPMEKKWVNAGTRRTAYYDRLHPGAYVFRVTSAGNEGDWNEKSAVLAFTVRPYLWQTLWFQVALVLGVGGGAFAWYFNRMARLEHARAAQEKFTHQLLLSQEKERKRLAYELHDGLGQDLLLIKNRLSLLAAEPKQTPEVTRQLSDISKNAARAIADLRAISHALRPSALEQVGLTKALEWMIQQVAEVSKTKFSSELQKIDGLLQPDMEMNLYRIVQEGLNNIIKHAQATEVIVEVIHPLDSIVVSIFDNGRGFENDGNGKPSNEGLGLAGMRERAKVLGGRFEIYSNPGKGTRVTVVVPVRKNEP